MSQRSALVAMAKLVEAAPHESAGPTESGGPGPETRCRPLGCAPPPKEQIFAIEFQNCCPVN